MITVSPLCSTRRPAFFCLDQVQVGKSAAVRRLGDQSAGVRRQSAAPGRSPHDEDGKGVQRRAGEAGGTGYHELGLAEIGFAREIQTDRERERQSVKLAAACFFSRGPTVAVSSENTRTVGICCRVSMVCSPLLVWVTMRVWLLHYRAYRILFYGATRGYSGLLF